MSIIGYARVSTEHQSLDQQRDTLTATGAQRIFTDHPTGRMLAGIFAALAAYERDLIHERAAAARATARARGRHTGRPPRLTPDQIRQVRALRAGGESISSLITSYGVSRATIYRALTNPTEDTTETQG